MTSTQVVQISVNNYDSPCQDYLYPQDHTQTRFDTSDHLKKRKSNNSYEELALTDAKSSNLASFYMGIR